VSGCWRSVISARFEFSWGPEKNRGREKGEIGCRLLRNQAEKFFPKSRELQIAIEAKVGRRIAVLNSRDSMWDARRKNDAQAPYTQTVAFSR
jgi:hypothetical protein